MRVNAHISAHVSVFLTPPYKVHISLILLLHHCISCATALLSIYQVCSCQVRPSLASPCSSSRQRHAVRSQWAEPPGSIQSWIGRNRVELWSPSLTGLCLV